MAGSFGALHPSTGSPSALRAPVEPVDGALRNCQAAVRGTGGPDLRGWKGRQYALRSLLGISLASMLSGANDLRVFGVTEGRAGEAFLTGHLNLKFVAWVPFDALAERSV